MLLCRTAAVSVRASGGGTAAGSGLQLQKGSVGRINTSSLSAAGRQSLLSRGRTPTTAQQPFVPTSTAFRGGSQLPRLIPSSGAVVAPQTVPAAVLTRVALVSSAPAGVVARSSLGSVSRLSGSGLRGSEVSGVRGGGGGRVGLFGVQPGQSYVVVRTYSSGSNSAGKHSVGSSSSSAAAVKDGNGDGGDGESDKVKSGDSDVVVASAKKDAGRIAGMVAGVMGFIRHTKLGFQLLWADMKVARKLLMKRVRGKTLTRREHNALVRTSADMFRIIPVSVFIIVPFMDFLLPVAVWMFPNMLPSTFEDKLKKEENIKKRLKAKIEMAKFLQEATAELANSQAKEDEDVITSEELTRFMKKVRKGLPVSNEDTRRFAKLFDDSFTIDHIKRPQLVAMCRYLDVSPIGTNAVLRYQLRSKMNSLTADDKKIAEEGVESLTTPELETACMARGMRGLGLPREVLINQLSQWLDLSLNSEVPKALVVLSRAFLITSTNRPEQAISKTLTEFSELALEDAVTSKSQAAAPKDSAEKRAARLDQLKREDALIAAEEAAAEAVELEAALEAAIEKAKETGSTVAAEFSAKDDVPEPVLGELASFVDTLASASPVAKERLDLADLKKMDAVLEAVTGATDPSGGGSGDRVTAALESRLDSMIASIEAQISDAESALGSLSNIDADGDGVISDTELEAALAVMKSQVSESQIRAIWKVVDKDKDGRVAVEELTKYLGGRIADFEAERESRIEDRVVEETSGKEGGDGESSGGSSGSSSGGASGSGGVSGSSSSDSKKQKQKKKPKREKRQVQ